MSKKRLDILLVEQGLAESREKAQRLILAGAVRINGQVADKAGKPCADDVVLEVTASDKFVSRGGGKLEARVYAVDVGKGQLDWRLRNDPRVIVKEELNARYLSERDIPEPFQFAVIDVSFISLTLILPPVTKLLEPGGQIVSLIKPQFEAGRENVGKGGVVRDAAVHESVVAQIRQFGTQVLPLEWLGLCESPLRGPAGNIEFLAWWRKL